MSEPVPVVLTIAGSDSGAGAGIQADLKTFAACGVYGVTALTCVTAQNPAAVRAVEALSVDMVRAQVAAIMDAFPVAAIKTGMLYTAETVACVAGLLRDYGCKQVVVDPVMVATSGGGLLRPDAVAALEAHLLPLARVVTPNIPEAERLAGMPIRSAAEMETAAGVIRRRHGSACVVKGGHLDEAGDRVIDVLCDDSGAHRFTVARCAARETHGTGCTFSAALAAALACGQSLADGVAFAQAFVAGALAHAVDTGRHVPLGQDRLLADPARRTVISRPA